MTVRHRQVQIVFKRETDKGKDENVVATMISRFEHNINEQNLRGKDGVVEFIHYILSFGSSN